MFRLALIAASAALASAYTTATTQCTDGCNPIAKPGLNEVVPAGSDYTVTWQPTTAGTVSIVLMKGPATNIVPLYAIAEKVANTGTFSWTPASDLEPTGDSGYGFQLINDADGTYQWSTQFGVSNAGYSGSASASASASDSAVPSESAAAGNGTISSAAATTTAAAPTGFSNSTAVITSPSSGAVSTTLSTASITGASTTSASSSASPSSGAVALGSVSIGGAFAAIMAAFAAL